MTFTFLGSEELAIGFRFVGVPSTVVYTAGDAREAFLDVTRKGEAKVVILTEDVSALIPREVMEWQLGGEYPLIVEIPGIAGHREGRRSLIDSIRDAVGIHV